MVPDSLPLQYWQFLRACLVTAIAFWFSTGYSYNQTNKLVKTISLYPVWQQHWRPSLHLQSSSRDAVQSSCLAAEALAELPELVLVHLALPLLLHAVRPHLRPVPIPSLAHIIPSSGVDNGRVYVEGGVEGEEEVPELRVRDWRRRAQERSRRGWRRGRMREELRGSGRGGGTSGKPSPSPSPPASSSPDRSLQSRRFWVAAEISGLVGVFVTCQCFFWNATMILALKPAAEAKKFLAEAD